jgi:hypothetical protein
MPHPASEHDAELVPFRMASSGMLCRLALVRTDVLAGTYRLHHQGDKNR